MKLATLKAGLGAAAMTLVSYSPAFAQALCDNPANPACVGGGGNDNGVGNGVGNGVPELAAPEVIALVAVGIVAAIALSKRK